jgi:hypothetical protein
MPSPSSALPSPPRGVSLEGSDVLSNCIHPHNRPEASTIDGPSTTDIDTLVNIAGRLRPSLPSNCPWFGQEDLKVVGVHPIDAGGSADVWAGEMGDRKVAIKSYRCHASADYAQVYGASNA